MQVLDAYSESSRTFDVCRMVLCFLILFFIIRKKNKPFKKVRIRLPLVPCFTQPHQGFTYIPSSQHYQSISGIVVADYSQFQTVTTEHTQSRVTGNRIS